MSYLSRPPRGQQRDKPYREALRMELAAAGEDMKKLREIAKVHIARCEAGDMQAIKELADRLDGRRAGRSTRSCTKSSTCRHRTKSSRSRTCPRPLEITLTRRRLSMVTRSCHSSSVL